MHAREHQEQERKQRHSRIRRVKKFLRPLPRRANVHRYPVIKWFADAARKRPYLWSFRSSEVVPALYAGFILTFIPLYGIQIPTAFVLSLLFRANLPVLIALQFISNPLTVPPIYIADYYTGKFILSFMGGAPALPAEVQDIANPETAKKAAGAVRQGFSIFGYTMVGGAIIGYFCGFISSAIYRIGSRHWKSRKQELRHDSTPPPKS